MHLIKNIINHQSLSTISGNHAKPVPPKSPENLEKSAVIDRLFLRLAALYGNTWRNLYKNSDFLRFAKDEWREALAAYEETSIVEALNLCREQHKFPPTVPEFIECCKALKRKHVFSKAENHNKARPEVAESNLNQIRSILNMPSR